MYFHFKRLENLLKKKMENDRKKKNGKLNLQNKTGDFNFFFFFFYSGFATYDYRYDEYMDIMQ